MKIHKFFLINLKFKKLKRCKIKMQDSKFLTELNPNSIRLRHSSSILLELILEPQTIRVPPIKHNLLLEMPQEAQPILVTDFLQLPN